jgi:hypothetical protein
MIFKHLNFFDKKGNNFNLLHNGEYYEGTIFFPQTSVGLIENEHIFIIEQFKDPVNATKYGYPLPANTTVDPLDAKWRIKWTQVDGDENYYFYQIKDEYVEEEKKAYPFIQKYSSLEIQTNNTPYSVDPISGIKIVSDLDLIESSSVSFNLAFTSEDEDIYERDLVIEDISDINNPVVIAKIHVYGETIGEDERFRLVLENFGRVFNQQDALILRDYDIKEAREDWKDINRKRKELLLAGEEIFPYVGGYKGLVNAIRFFEYQDLRVKEYWLNVNPDTANHQKYSMVELVGLIQNGVSDVQLSNPFTPNPNYKKTSLFSLVYDITRATGSEDEFGVPLTEDAFIFDPEEVLIKLFALKNRLKRDFLPLNARIVDITGEGIYFEKYDINSWSDQLIMNKVDVGSKVSFEIEPKSGFISDLRSFHTKKYPGGLDFPLSKYTNSVEPYELAQIYPPDTLQGLLDSIRAYYVDDQNGLIENFGDEDSFTSVNGKFHSVPCGMPVILKNKTFDVTWEDLENVTWDALLNTPLLKKITLNNIGSPAPSTIGIIDQITSDINFINSVTCTFTGDPIVDAANLANAISLSPLYPFTEFNILYTPGDDFFYMRDKTKSDVVFGFIPTDDTFLSIEGANDDCISAWDYLGTGKFYELEWIIEKGGTNPYYFKIRGDICDYQELPHFLPHPGNYDVTLNLFDTFNGTSTNIEKQTIEVYPKELEINTFCRFRNREQYTWDDMVNTWEEYAGSSWDRIAEGTDFGNAPVPQYVLNFKQYKYQNIEYKDETNGNWYPYDGFNIPYNAPKVLRNWGTKVPFTWENMDNITWDDMFHTTWEMMDYHADFLGGFEIFDPQPGDTIQIGKFDPFIFGNDSPPPSPYTLQDAVDELNASILPGISNFDYTLMDPLSSKSPFGPSPLLTQYIQADAKFPGADGYYFIKYTGNVLGDPYSFRFPNWLDRPILDSYDDFVIANLQKFTDANPFISNPEQALRDYLFLSPPSDADIISGAVGTQEYWENSEFDKGSPPVNGINAGNIVSWAGDAAFTSSDIRGFKDNFAVPKGVPVFFATAQSKVFGKNDFRWILYKQDEDGNTQIKVIELRGKPFFIWRFEEVGDYTIELFAKDSNNNEYNVKRNGLCRVVDKETWINKVDRVTVGGFDALVDEIIIFP